jgi:hypothetical protein
MSNPFDLISSDLSIVQGIPRDFSNFHHIQDASSIPATPTMLGKKRNSLSLGLPDNIGFMNSFQITPTNTSRPLSTSSSIKKDSPSEKVARR